MIFSSIPFLYYFLPCMLILYYLLPFQYKNLVLLLTSLVFYAWGEPSYVFLMIATIVIGYGSGYAMDMCRKCGNHKGRKLSLWIGLLFCIGALAFFKYAGFLITNICRVQGLLIGTAFGVPAMFEPILKIALPVGISFYTFQILSYLLDVYWGDVPVQKNIVSFGAYVTMFPQLIAGPIVRYGDIIKELEERKLTMHDTAIGIRRFTVGFAKKILIANQLGELCDVFRASSEKSILFYWMYAAAVSLQVYFDFSGYSDMAIGLGRILGFKFPENFEYPFISKSITEFWRRWHMTLGTWFRDYVYIPLGGNRVKKGRWYLNIFLVWMLTGLWHGAAWNFVLWGLYFAVLLLIEKQWLLKYLKQAKIWNHIYVLFLVVFSFLLFDASNLAAALETIGSLFGVGKVGSTLVFSTTETMYYLRSYAVILVIAVVGATPVIKRLTASVMEKIKHSSFAWIVMAAEPVMLIFLLAVCTAYLVDGSFNPFLYFRF